MTNKRLQQLIYMLSLITDLSKGDAEQAVLSTDTGKAVQRNEPGVMYEQQTENLYSIREELSQNPAYEELAGKISVSSIVDAYKKMQEDVPTYVKREERISKNPQLKEIEKTIVKQKRKNNLKQQYQNLLNWGGVKNVD